jgi:hypothetical protein
LRRAEGGAKIVGVFRVKNHDFTPKDHIFSNFKGGVRRVRPPPESAPAITSFQSIKNCENRKDPALVQAFLKKWWVESDFKAPNLPLSLRLKVSGCYYNSIYNNA